MISDEELHALLQHSSSPMITTNSRDQQAAKLEDEKLLRAPSSASTMASAGFRNPRIVRVSRAFGGKDRHSKVCTVRGLRDRRIRLSVPTAVQLYELQDRLGLSQPSKVVDWLMEATKSDIDKLPPLQFPQGSSLLGQFQNPNSTKSIEQDHRFRQNLFGFHDTTSSSSSSFNSQLFLRGQPDLTASVFAPTYTQYTADPINHEHTARSSSRVIVNHGNHLQLLTSNTIPSTISSQISHTIPNYSLMPSSLHNSSTANDSPHSLIKSIFNPRFLSQSIFGKPP